MPALPPRFDPVPDPRDDSDFDTRLYQACVAGRKAAIVQLCAARPDRVPSVWGQLTWQGQAAALKALAACVRPPIEGVLGWLGESSGDEVRACQTWPGLVEVPQARAWLKTLASELGPAFPELHAQLTARLRETELAALARPSRSRPRS